MSNPLLTESAQVMCTHGGTATVTASNQQSKAAGSPILTVSDVHQVAGCPFAPGGVSSPCATVVWSAPATSVRVNGIPALHRSSIGLCIGPAGLQGTATITNTQTDVKGS